VAGAGTPVYCVVHPAARLLHTELTPFILTEQFALWNQPRYFCWQHHVSGQRVGAAHQGGYRRESVRRAAHAAATVCGRVAEWEVAVQRTAPAIPPICAAGLAARVKACEGAR
jgi:hypothetical protein